MKYACWKKNCGDFQRNELHQKVVEQKLDEVVNDVAVNNLDVRVGHETYRNVLNETFAKKFVEDVIAEGLAEDVLAEALAETC